MTLQELFDRHYLPYCAVHLKDKTVAEYSRLWERNLRPMMGDRTIDTITFSDVEGVHLFIKGRVQANRALALLSGAFSYAVQRGLVPANPCRGIRRNKEKGREFFYTPAQTKAILKAAWASDDVAHRYIALELLTGVRPGELLDSGPHWRHGGVLRTPDGKTGARTIFLSPAASAFLEALPAREDGRYFPPGMSLRRPWERLCKLAKVPQARLYDLRHTYASAALAAGTSLPVIGQLLGHRKAQTTMRYTHLAPDVGLEAAAKAAERMTK
jgi:integrase